MAAVGYTPEQLAEIGKQLGSTYRDGEARILRILARGDITSWNRAFKEQQLAQIRQVLDQLPQEAANWAQLHIPAMYQEGMRVAAQRLPGGMDLGMTKLHQDAVRILGENMALRLGDATDRVGRTVDDVFRKVGMANIQQAFVGGETRAAASKAIVADLQKQGMTSFVDRAGRSWDLGTYAEMVARTTSREATQTGTVNKGLQEGTDLFQIDSYGGACDDCARWEGEIVSATGSTPGYPTLDEAEADGFGHPNCGHTLMPYVSDEQIMSGE